MAQTDPRTDEGVHVQTAVIAPDEFRELIMGLFDAYVKESGMTFADAETHLNCFKVFTHGVGEGWILYEKLVQGLKSREPGNFADALEDQ